ncbi:MAG: hypothetical protein Q9160_003100 [Pyrenula sp. 1 TL-2023]
MATTNLNQLFLLADHIKLSLLERQRAISLDLAPNSQDNQISRSLESLREGLESLESQSSSSSSSPELSNLRSQYNDLSRQFYGENPSSTAVDTLTSPNDPSLASDFSHAQSRTSISDSTQRPPQPSSKLKSSRTDSTSRHPANQPQSKSVRFRDSPSEQEDSEDEANRAALFPAGRYTDEPSSSPDPSQLSNQQIHMHHAQVLADQDEQLDTLSVSIGRQRHLSMQIGDELEGQVALLDDVDRGVDRHQGRLDGAKRRLDRVSKKARENWGMTTIIVLIVILVFLIVVLK